MESNDLDSKVTDNLAKFFNITELKTHQCNVIHQMLVKQRDCLVVLPTGEGKSLNFEALTVAYRELFSDGNKDIVLSKYCMLTHASTCSIYFITLKVRPAPAHPPPSPTSSSILLCIVFFPFTNNVHIWGAREI